MGEIALGIAEWDNAAENYSLSVMFSVHGTGLELMFSGMLGTCIIISANTMVDDAPDGFLYLVIFGNVLHPLS